MKVKPKEANLFLPCKIPLVMGIRNAENNILSWTSIMTHAKRSLVWFFVFSYNFCVSKVFLSVVIPSFDEMVNLQKGVLDKVMRFLNAQKYTYEVIVVDDG